MSANVNDAGEVKQLDRKAEPIEQVTEEQVQDSPRLARLLMGLLRDVADLKRRWSPRRIDFEDRVVDGTATTKYRFAHGLDGRVRWSVVGWKDAVAGHGLVQHEDTDDGTLVLISYVAGTVTVRVEIAG